MADIELVIKIPEELVEWIDKYYDSIRILNGVKIGIIIEAIKNGVTIPKGHGRLIDADELKKHKYHDNDRYENAVSIAQVDRQPTIIEADKEGEK